MFFAAQLDDVLDGVWLGDHIHHVGHMEDLVALGDKGTLAAVDGCDAELDMFVLVDDLVDGLAENFGLGFQFHHEELQVTACEVVGLRRGVFLQQ